MIGAVGDDIQGQVLLEHAERLGLDTQACLRIRGRVSDGYTAVLNPDGNLLLGLAAMPLVERLNPWALEPSKALRAGAAMIVADGNLPGDTWPLLLEEARRGTRLVGVTVSEAKMARLPDDLQGLHLLVLNEGELLTVAPDRDAALAALHARGVEHLLVSLGAQGALLSSAGQAPRHWPVKPVEVLDVTGAGDAFAAGVCAVLLNSPGDFDRAIPVGLRLAALTLQTAHSVHPELDQSFLTP
jgi:pseudouridine kinase